MVVRIRSALGRPINIGPAEVFFIVDIGVEGVLFGNPDFVGLALQLFDAAVNAAVAVYVNHEVPEERRTGKNRSSGACKSVGHAVNRSCQRAGFSPVSGLGAYDKDVHSCSILQIKIYL